MKRFLITLFIFHLSFFIASAQDDESGYKFLDIPASAHNAALGGSNITFVEDDATTMFTNAALLTGVSDKSLSLGYTTYIADSQLMTAGFAKNLGERATWAVGAQVLNYGKETEYDPEGNAAGEFTMRDINIQGSFAYMLSDYITGAVTAKAIMSTYGEYSSTAIGADLALHYFDEESGLSVSATGRNFGGQIDPLYDEKQTLPFNLALGMSKDLANAPFRFSVTADDITHWDDVKFIQHFIVGADIFPSKNTWVAVGYNFRRAKEMKVADSSHGAGLSIGGGLNTKRIKVGVAYAKYHIAASSLVLNLAFTL